MFQKKQQNDSILQLTYAIDDIEKVTEEKLRLYLYNLISEMEISLFKQHKFPIKGKLLEIGCNCGITSSKLSEHYPRMEICSIDSDSDAIANAKESLSMNYPNIEFSVGTAYNTRKSGDQFDILYNRLNYQYLSDPIKALDEAQRVLKKDGQIIIIDIQNDLTIFAPELEAINNLLEQSDLCKHSKAIDLKSATRTANYLHQAGYTNINSYVKSFSTSEVGLENLICAALACYAHTTGIDALRTINKIRDNIMKMKLQPFGMIALSITTAQAS